MKNIKDVNKNIKEIFGNIREINKNIKDIFPQNSVCNFIFLYARIYDFNFCLC